MLCDDVDDGGQVFWYYECDECGEESHHSRDDAGATYAARNAGWKEDLDGLTLCPEDARGSQLFPVGEPEKRIKKQVFRSMAPVFRQACEEERGRRASQEQGKQKR